MNRRAWLGLVVWLLLSYLASLIGRAFTADAWYEQLATPSWAPPGWTFGLVWSILYILMAVAAWLVWKEKGFGGAPTALGLYVLQLVLNAAWPWLFFGLRRPDLALFEIVLLWAVLVATLIAFWRIRPLSGWLLLPYLLWVTFAGALNFEIWRLNS